MTRKNESRWKERDGEGTSRSSDSLGTMSQHSCYSDFGDDDITDLIRDYPPTQSEGPLDSAPSSFSSSSLGKRKARDISTSASSSATSSQEPSRPTKSRRSDLIKDEIANPFLEKQTKVTEPEDPYAPIRYSLPRMLQGMLESKKMPYGVQFEIARCVSHGQLKYSQIHLPDLGMLAELGSNEKAAPATLKVILKGSFGDDEGGDLDKFKTLFAKEHAAKFPWKELDREEGMLVGNPFGGLGFNKEGERMEWHGGQVLFSGKLQDASKGCKKFSAPKYKVILEPAALGPSTMFARRFGSKHFFRLKLPKHINKDPDALLQYLQRPLLLCGFVFRAFYAKESNVFYVKTNEVTDGNALIPGETIPGIMSFLEFLDWHNSIQLNANQKMAKYVSRFALGLSNSVPGLMVDQSNIHLINDIVSLTGSNMTDGAGKINRWSLRQMRHRLGWDDKPTAIQMRIFGTKGLLVDDGRNADEFGYVGLTPSQTKIKFPGDTEIDPAHRIIDILRASHAKAPCRLSVETIINLSYNGVPEEAFVELLKQSLAGLIEPLLDWESPNAMRALWCNVCRLGGVMAARRAREEVGAARAKGFSERAADELQSEDEDGFLEFDLAEQAQRSSAWWGDEVSGCPSSLEETIMCMLDANLTPKDCPVLRDKLHKFTNARVTEFIKSYRIEVPMSASAFLIPDTDGILEEGEVFFKSSRRLFRNPDGTDTDIYTGDILITRHPCKLPTDTQKWKSVDVPGLHHLVDVIVLSTKGNRRAADLLAGGDYDGDKGIFIYQPELVHPFKNAAVHLADPPPDIEKYFVRKNEDVGAFTKRTESLPTEQQIRERQYYLLGSIRDTSVYGSYSNFHEIATYTLGYDHKETLRMAHIFNMTLDGVKTGKTILPDAYKNDKGKYDKMPPDWKGESEEERERRRQGNQARVRRPSRLGQFIMDFLHEQAKDHGGKWLQRIKEHFESVPRSTLDEDLARPWKQAVELSERWETVEHSDRMKRDLKSLEEHVEKIYAEHRSQMTFSPRKSRSSPTKGKSGISFTDLPIEVRQDKIRNLSKKFAAFPHPIMMAEEEIARIMASYAYFYDFLERKSYSNSYNFTRFPWDVALRELCGIKARATGRHRVVAGEFYDHFKMKHPNPQFN